LLEKIKMDRSTIANKSAIERAVKFAVNEVRTWTRQELKSILSNPTPDKHPLIIPVGNGFIIGNYAMKPIAGQWHVLYRYNDTEHMFVTKHSAMLYVILQQLNRYELASRILEYNTNINRLTIETERFRIRISQAAGKKNFVAYDLYTNRYQESMTKLQHNQFLLEKSLKMAKYINF